MKSRKHPARMILALGILIAVCGLAVTANAAGHGYRTIYRFQGGIDGWLPTGVPAVDKNGDLYGTTVDGGINNWGTIYKLAATQTQGGWKKSILYNFAGGNDGGSPASMVFGEDGDLYGVSFDHDRIFRLSPPVSRDSTWKYTVLYTLNETTDGSAIQGNLVFDAAGNLYGATEQGGDTSCPGGNGFGCGTVFELKRPTKTGGKWHFNVLYAFTGNPDGVQPFAGVTFDQKGNLYGTTNYGGTFGYGTAYRLTSPKKKGRAWTESVLYSFDLGNNMGSSPGGPVAFDNSGIIYGTTAFGGDLNCQGGFGCGVVFQLAPPTRKGGAWTYTTLYAFQGGSDGIQPVGYMVFDGQGNIYSTTYRGGETLGGTAFRLRPTKTSIAAWTETVLHWFPKTKNDGYEPVHGLTWGKWGDLYGIAGEGGGGSACGCCGCGTVFELQP